jgi:hypothetical protein
MIASGIDPTETDHEGVVIRNKNFSPHPFKITGEFIVSGMHGNFAKVMGNKVIITESYLRKLINTSLRRIFYETNKKTINKGNKRIATKRIKS